MSRAMIRLCAFLFLSSYVLIGGSFAQEKLSADGTETLYDPALKPFYHGVASGDPLKDRVIIWTRVTPSNHQNIEVEWQMSLDEDFGNIVKSGQVSTSRNTDYTVKIDVGGLQSGTKYYYKFKALSRESIVGRTKTATSGDEPISLGIVSCSNYQWGYFNAYDDISKQELDAVVHLGDYIYEHGPDGYGDTTIGRFHLPPKEIIELSDYRTRYAQYRLDSGLRKAHQNHPFIVIWDDHEVANNSYKDGAQNHQADEGLYETRKQLAKQAYYEWLPVRVTEPAHLYRKLTFGPLVDLIMLDERLEGREAPADSYDQAALERTMLGLSQLNWLKTELKDSKAKWKVIGNQVIFAELELSKARPNAPKNLDAWDGYSNERDHIMQFIKSQNIDNVLLVTGDTHSSWAFEVPMSITDYSSSQNAYAIELGTPSISSANWNENRSDEQVIMGENFIKADNPHLKYVNGRDHGYMILTLNTEEARCDWHYVNNLRTTSYQSQLVKSYLVKRGESKLIEK